METNQANGIVDGVHVCLGIPTYDGTLEVTTAFKATSQASQKIRFTPLAEGSSSLCQVFNRLWIQALGSVNQPFTHFAMLHSDLNPDPWWLDNLYDVMQSTGATVVSAVSAIKDAKGVTSTAAGDPNDEWDYRRLTLGELKKLPESFAIDDISRANFWPESYTKDKCLLVNTGCMLIDLRWPHWMDKQSDGLTMQFRFNQDFRVQQWPSGKWCPEFSPEDWQMSRYIHRKGGKVVATQKVNTFHIGKAPYPSNAVWGNSTDVEIDKFLADKAESFKASTA